MSVESLPAGFDAWKCREPEPDTYVVDVDEIDDQGNPSALDDEERDRRVLGGACLNVDPMHASDECFDRATMDAYYAGMERAS